MIRLVSFLIDALVVFFIVRMFVRLVSGGSSARRAPRPGPPPREVAGGTLVRDPQCGTYVPESRALRIGSGDQTLYFCSTTCRDAYQHRA